MRTVQLENPPLFRTILESGFEINWSLKSLGFTPQGSLRYMLTFSKDDLPPDVDSFVIDHLLVWFGSREEGKEKRFTMENPHEVDLSINEVVDFEWVMHQHYESEAI